MANRYYSSLGAPNYGANASPIVKQGVRALGEYNMIVQLMEVLGVSPRVAHFIGIQTAWETNGFTSNLARTHFNYSGIKFLNDPSRQTATRGNKAPDGGYYAKYANITDWARDLIRVLSFGARPIDATSVEDYAERLKRNNYYGDTLERYTAGIKRWEKLFHDYKDADYAVRNPTTVADSERPAAGIIDWIKENPKLSIGAGIALLVLLRR